MNKGFTLIELLVVMVIVTLLLTLMFATLNVSKKKYIIHQNDWSFYTNDYQEDENGCLKFLDDKEEIKLCGDYFIKDQQ